MTSNTNKSTGGRKTEEPSLLGLAVATFLLVGMGFAIWTISSKHMSTSSKPMIFAEMNDGTRIQFGSADELKRYIAQQQRTATPQKRSYSTWRRGASEAAIIASMSSETTTVVIKETKFLNTDEVLCLVRVIEN